MGTRNLTVVIHGGTHRIAQYGQWDGQPGGQGRTVLKFCLNHLTHEGGRAAFKAALGRCRFGSDAELEAVTGAFGWLTTHPQLSRDMAAEVLTHVLTCPQGAEVLLRDEYEFAQNSLFCEWAYVIDLDLGVLEMYRGFNRLALDPAVDRFALQRDGEDPYAVNAISAAGNVWQPVKLVQSWRLDQLPTQAELEVAGREGKEDLL